MRFKYCFWLVLLLHLSSIKSAKILGVFHNPSKSHFSLGHTLLEALAAKGHDVTMLSPFKVNSSYENYESIQVDGLQTSKDAVIEQVTHIIDDNTYNKIFNTIKNYQTLSKVFLSHPTVKDFLNSGRKYDVVIIDWILNDAFLGFADHFNAHSIVFNSFTSSFVINKIVANPAPSSYVTNPFPPLSDNMNFFQRMHNFLANAFVNLLELHIRSLENNILQEHFPNAPHMTELLHNVSLVFVNSHFTTESPRPFVPSIIQIGGIHIKEPKQLKGELKTFMDEATEGVVYCSFGSVVKSAEMSKDKIQAIIKAFSNLNVKVLWKFESDHQLELPPNVRTAKWFSQSNVLAHPNVKAFITHGGLLSVTEAMYHGVPLIGSPFFGDQESNVEHGVGKGYAVKLRFNELTEDTLTKAIKEVLENPRYTENMKQRSKAFKDRLVHPLDNAIYWVEYVVRHNGAHHLKTAALKLTWYQYYLLDVFAFIGLLLILIFLILRSLFKFIVRKIFGKVKIVDVNDSNNISIKKKIN